MVAKKDSMIVSLATFCLTATLFLIVPISSSPNGYNPWLDVNDDGKINILDFSAVALAWQATGDPTKNVNVTNWPTMQPEPAYKVVKMPEYNMSWTNGVANFSLGEIYVGGFSRAFVDITLIGPMEADTWPPAASPGNHIVNIRTSFIWWLLESHSSSAGFQRFSNYNDPQSGLITVWVINGTVASWTPPIYSEDSYISVKAPYMDLGFTANATTSTGWVNIEVLVYLRSE